MDSRVHGNDRMLFGDYNYFMSQKILVTGGAGYIGSHTVLQLLKQNCQVIVLDNLERGYQAALDRVQELAGKPLIFFQADLRQPETLAPIFASHSIDAVIHFAAYKDVGEADKDPEKYYLNNVVGTLNLLSQMQFHQVKKIVFSSTSAVYGDADQLPITEQTPLKPKNAYGRSKAAVEWVLDDYFNSYGISSVRLRYFNAAGADPSGKLGEDPRLCGNVIPLVMQTLIGQRDKFLLYGDHFATPDGTQERDFIHVADLATAHVASLDKLNQISGSFYYNLGTGQPTSVNQIIHLSEEISGKKLNYQVVDPRPGDALVVYCDPTKAKQELNWEAKLDIHQIISDQWNWVVQNPQGFA